MKYLKSRQQVNRLEFPPRNELSSSKLNSFNYLGNNKTVTKQQFVTDAIVSKTGAKDYRASDYTSQALSEKTNCCDHGSF